jgi:hypothetical protein
VLKGSTLLRRQRVVTALPELDAVLPLGGLVAGSLVELHADEGAGALELAFRIAAHQQHERRWVLAVDPTGDLHAPALARCGIELERTIVVRPPAQARASRGTPAWVLGALDESLRSRAIAATVARVGRLEPAASHRLRVAVEAGGGLGVLVRPVEEHVAVSAAAVRLIVERTHGSLRVQPLRVRGGVALGPWRV